MKRVRWIGSAVLALFMVVTVLAMSADARRQMTSRQASWGLSEEEAATLRYMREEEKLARDVYRAMYQAYQAPIFANISRSEQRHTSQVQRLLTKYGIEDPVVDDTEGEFFNADLETLYKQLTEQGMESTLAAFKVGALIEETDIVDLQDGIAGAAHADIKRVYTNLMEASKNHLRAFVGQIEASGDVYIPQKLSQDKFDAIVN
jgi:hypothetical protein